MVVRLKEKFISLKPLTYLFLLSIENLYNLLCSGRQIASARTPEYLFEYHFKSSLRCHLPTLFSCYNKCASQADIHSRICNPSCGVYRFYILFQSHTLPIHCLPEGAAVPSTNKAKRLQLIAWLDLFKRLELKDFDTF